MKNQKQLFIRNNRKTEALAEQIKAKRILEM